MDTVINVIPSADISKTRKITFFSITSKISIFASRNFLRIQLGVVWNYPVQKIGVFQVKWQGRIKSNILLHHHLLFKNRNQKDFKTFTEGWSNTYLPWKQIKGRGFVQCNATFRCICNITYSWAQSKVISVTVNFERRLYVRKDITVDNFFHNL